MLTIESEKSKGKKFDKNKLKAYWKKIYPKKYVELLVGSAILEKIAGKSRSVPLTGVLKQRDNGFVYIDISNNFIHAMYSLIDEEGIEKPPYFGDSNAGAHISVMYEDELDEDTEISELGKEFSFKLGKFVSIDPDGWNEMDRVWFLKVESKELEELRKKYGLGRFLNGHDFHITVAIKKKK